MGKGITIQQMQMKHRRAGVTDVQQLLEDSERYIDEEYEANAELVKGVKVAEEVSQGVNYNAETLSDIWNFVAENIEREKWKSYTREDWEQLEHEYVEKAQYTEQDLFDDILTAYEDGELTADEAQAKAKEYHKCSYRFCLNVFKPRRTNQWYCDADCRKREHNAVKRFEETGTYLPASVYKDNRDDTDKRNYEKKEVAFDMQENSEMLERHQIKDIYGGLRDKQREAYYFQEVSEKDLKDSQKDSSKRQRNHVTYEESRSAI